MATLRMSLELSGRQPDRDVVDPNPRPLVRSRAYWPRALVTKLERFVSTIRSEMHVEGVTRQDNGYGIIG